MSFELLAHFRGFASRPANRAKVHLLFSLVAASLAAGCQPRSAAGGLSAPSPWLCGVIPDGVALPGPASVVQLRLFTNASPDGSHLFNTFDLEAFGETLLRSPARAPFGPLTGVPPWDKTLHHILINGTGPELAAANSMRLVEQASGPEWRYWAWDLTGAYRGRVRTLRRAVVFVEPDLFVFYDRLVAPEPVSFDMLLHPPSITVLDTNWGDLRLDLPKAGLRIHSPAPKGFLRPWSRVSSSADTLLPDTVTMRLGPTNRVSELDLLTVLVVYPAGGVQGFAFKFLESPTALGARIHRQHLPTLVAFRTASTAPVASLSTYEFTGPVGVAVFKPKPRSR